MLSFRPVAAQSFNDNNVFKFLQFYDLVVKNYVDSVDKDELIEDAIVAMLQELDPHSIYISKEDVQAMNEPLEGNFEGIGIQFNILRDTIIVVSPIPGGPSEKLGIRAGDRIIYVEDENVAGTGINNKGVAKRLRGKKGTKVEIRVKRRGVKKLLKFTIERDKIPIFSIDASYMIDDQVGYIKVNRFSKTTDDEFRKAFKGLEDKGMEKLVLDLSGNSGGYLNQAIYLADHFLDRNHMIVYTEGLHKERNDYKATSTGIYEEGGLVVMIDEGSASASEIVSGAVQDWDRGVIVGRRSYGKGLVQSPYRLSDGSMVRLTVARYYTPTGRCIQRPYEEGSDAYNMELVNRYNSGELMHEDSIHFPESEKYRTLENNRFVFGGGGIMPDLFVPLDTIGYTDYSGDLVRQGFLTDFVLDYTDKNRDGLLEKYPDVETFKNNYTVHDGFIRDLAEYAKKQGLEINEEELSESTEKLRIRIKALMARDLWSLNEYYYIVNKEDPVFQKAVEIIRSEEEYEQQLSRKK